MFKPRAARIFRFLTVAATAAFALFCVLLLVIRFFIFPRIDDYRERIETTLTAQLGQPVAIAAIETGWDGWNPRLTIRGVQVHDRARPSDGPLVDLPRIDLVVSWTSLPLLDLRLKELAIDRPQLSVRRDKAGRLHVAGIEIDPDRQSDDRPATEWLLRQPSIIVTDALLTWTDELRGAPQLVLDHVEFRLEHSFGNHRFGLVGTPPAELASPLDFRGDVTDASLKDWHDAHGRFYVRLDYADIALWHEWIPLPIAVDNGKGALRAWFDFADGAPTGMVADFELADVRTRLGKNLPQLDLADVAGHLDWKRQVGKRVLVASGLTFTTPAALKLPPTDFSLTLTEASDGTVNGGSLTIDHLDAEPLTALAAHLQLPESLRHLLVQYSPRGTLSNGKFSWSGFSAANADIPEKFSASGNLQRVGFAPVQGIPGVDGLSGRFELDQAHGSANFDSHDLRLDAPKLWTESLAFTSVGGNVTWDKRDTEWRVAIDNLRLAGSPLSGVVNATWTGKGDGPGRLDLRASAGNAAVPDVARYMPLVLEVGLRDWLRNSLKQGTASDVRVNLTGDLANFPFADNRSGKFLISLKVNDGTLSFLPDWPPIEGLDADLKFEGARMTIDAVRAHTLGAHLGPTKADIPNLGAAHPVLTVVGTATGPTSEFLQYIAQSPVDGWIGHVTEGASATGDGKLELKLTLPLGKESESKVAGEFQFIGNELRFPSVPVLGRVNGRLAFTEQEVRAQEVAFEALGGPAKVGISSADGRVRVAGSGTANLAALRNELDVPMLDHVSGSTDWQVNLESAASAVSWSLSSSMKGAVVDLPTPIGKSAADAAPLKIERRQVPGRANEDLVTAQYKDVLRVVAHRSLVAAGMAPDRVLVSLGAGATGTEAPSRPGIAVRGQLPQLDIDQWLALYAREKKRMTAGDASRGHALEMNSMDLDVGTLDIFGRVMHDFKVNAQRDGEDWQLTMAGREVDGHATWRGASAELPNGRLMARLTRFVPPAAGELHVVRGEPDASGNTANPWPELDIVSDTFVTKGRDLGKLDLVAQPTGSDWHIQQLSLSNPDGRLDANGWWRVHGNGQQTLIDATVDVTDAGGYLARFGYGGLVRNAPTKISGKLQWTGAPNDFDYPTLTGSFSLSSGSGQFLKVDPGIGKLLGVLSLQALPRRITLDFHDVFSEGFAFDDIAGDVRIDNGLMHTDNLKLVGPSAAVAIKGDADLAKETQRLDVRVQPALSSGVSAGAAVLFIANPLVGVAVGAGALIAQKLFNNPIDQMFSFEYRVTGPWADPIVERVNPRELTTKAPPETGFGSEPITK